MEAIRNLWNSIELVPMPFGHRSIAIEGVSLTIIQSDLGMCIIAFLENGGKLSSPRKELLTQSINKLKQAFDKCTQEGKEYFQKYLSLAEMVEKSV